MRLWSSRSPWAARRFTRYALQALTVKLEPSSGINETEGDPWSHSAYIIAKRTRHAVGQCRRHEDSQGTNRPLVFSRGGLGAQYGVGQECFKKRTATLASCFNLNHVGEAFLRSTNVGPIGTAIRADSPPLIFQQTDEKTFQIAALCYLGGHFLNMIAFLHTKIRTSAQPGVLLNL